MIPRRTQKNVPCQFIRFAFCFMLLGTLVGANAMAQSPILAAGSASGSPGSSVIIPVQFNPGSASVCTLQFDLIFSPSLSFVSASTGAASSSAGKRAYANAISGGVRLLIFGFNQNALSSGPIAHIQMNVSAAANTGSLSLKPGGVVASDPAANSVQVSMTSGNITVLAAGDTFPPQISSVLSSDPTSTGVIITWTTDEASTAQIEYGTSTSYGKSTKIDTTLDKFHAQALSGLMEGTAYHYRVKSSDSAGNLATSGDYTFTTKGKNSGLEISDVAVSNVTSRSATISWTTDRDANSEVEYWIEGSDARGAALDDMVTRHTIALKGLQKHTLYRFRVKSMDSEGDLAASPEYNFSTTEKGSFTFALPRFALAGEAQESAMASARHAEGIMGMALANLDSERASLAFTAIESDGCYTHGWQIYNPRTYELEPGAQLPIHDSTIFGDGLAVTNSDGWIRLDTDTSGIDGLFMIFDSDLNYMDGANIEDDTLTDLIFTEIQANGHNRLNIANKNAEDVSVTLKLMGADGAVRRSESRVIAKNGALTADLFNDLFAGLEAKATDYVRVSADQGVQSFQVLQPAKGDISMLAGQNAAGVNTTLYSPQYVLGGQYRTSLSVVNLDSRKGTVQFRFFAEDGKQIGSTRTLVIPGNGKLLIDDPSFFASLDLEKMTSGYVEMVSDGIRLAGSTVFGDINRQTFASALALISELQTSMLFSHVASNDLFFTGIAILNPNSSAAKVTLELLDADGKMVEETLRYIPAGNKRARLLPQYFGSLNWKDQTSGYVRLKSDLPVASFSLFGTHNLSVLSAIPPRTME